MGYQVLIEEVLQRTVEIEASNEEEAVDKCWQKYYQEDLVLTSDDYKFTYIQIVTNDNN